MVSTPPKSRVLVIALVCINVVLLAVGTRYIFFPDQSTQTADPLVYDTELSSLPEHIVAAAGKDWQLLVVVFVSADNPILRLRYLETVYRRHHKSGLSVIGVCRSSPEQSAIIKRRFDLSFPIISEAATEIHSALRFPISGLDEGVILIDSNRRVKYSDQTTPSEDSIRILIEKYLFNSVDYSYHRVSPADFWRVDGKLPAMQLRNIRTGAETSLHGGEFANKTLVIYLTGCAPCRIQNYLNNLATLEKQSTERSSVTAIFPASFSTQDLLSHAENLQIRSPIFVMAGGEDSPDEYITRYDASVNEPFLVSVGKSGLIGRIEPLDGDRQ